jgi:hypothetical protein
MFVDLIIVAAIKLAAAAWIPTTSETFIFLDLSASLPSRDK